MHWKDWYWSWNSNTLARDVKNWLIRKDPDAGKDWGQEEQGMTENEMVGWHHRLNGQEFEQAPGVADGQRGLACSPWGHKELDTTEWLKWLKINAHFKNWSIMHILKQIELEQSTHYLGQFQL